MFEVKISPSIDKGKISLRTSGEFEFIGRSRVNNGIQGYTNKLSYEPNKSKTFSVSQVGTIVAQFRQKRWYSSQNIFILSVKHDTEIINNWLYILSSLNKALQRFDGGYSNYPTKSSLSNLQLTLPIKSDGTIAFDYMEAYIKELEAERIKELEAYLIATGLNDYALTDEEQRAIDKFRNGEIRWGEFNVKAMFDKVPLKKHKKDFDKKRDTSTQMSAEFNLPLVNAKIGDNGIMFFGRKEDFDSAEMVIDIISNGAVATGTVYPQVQKVGVLWDAYLLKSKFNVNESQLIFLSATLQKSIKLKFAWENKAVWTKVQNEQFRLPVNQLGEPDYEYMNLYISAIEKLVIRGVVEWKDKQIEATKSVINEK